MGIRFSCMAKPWAAFGGKELRIATQCAHWFAMTWILTVLPMEVGGVREGQDPPLQVTLFRGSVFDGTKDSCEGEMSINGNNIRLRRGE